MTVTRVDDDLLGLLLPLLVVVDVDDADDADDDVNGGRRGKTRTMRESRSVDDAFLLVRLCME